MNYAVNTPRHKSRDRGFFSPYGGKAELSRKIALIIDNEPHSSFAEIFVGSAQVYCARRSFAETTILNDLNGEVMNLWRCLQTRTDELYAAIEANSPHGDELLSAAKLNHDDPIMRAWAYLYSMQRTVMKNANALRVEIARGDKIVGGKNVHRMACNQIMPVAHKIFEAILLCRPAMDIIDFVDEPETLIYADPPYVGTTQQYGGVPKFTDADFVVLIDRLLNFKGKVVLSHFPHPAIDKLRNADWTIIEYEMTAKGAYGKKGEKNTKGKTEIIACNFRPCEMSLLAFGKDAAARAERYQSLLDLPDL